MGRTANTILDGKHTLKVRELISVNEIDTFLTGKGDINLETGNWKVSVFITTQQVSHSNKKVTEATIKRAATVLEDLIRECMAAEKKIKLDSDTDGVIIPGLETAT